jgi:hypothetical protein
MGQTYGLPVHPVDWSDLVLSHPFFKGVHHFDPHINMSFAQHELHISISDGAKTQASLITEGETANAWWGKGRVRADHDHGCFLMSRNFRQQEKSQIIIGATFGRLFHVHF